MNLDPNEFIVEEVAPEVDDVMEYTIQSEAQGRREESNSTKTKRYFCIFKFFQFILGGTKLHTPTHTYTHLHTPTHTCQKASKTQFLMLKKF